MEEQFPPLQNDLILRVARGEQFVPRPFYFYFNILETKACCADCISGETVERPPIWVMRQGETSSPPCCPAAGSVPEYTYTHAHADPQLSRPLSPRVP